MSENECSDINIIEIKQSGGEDGNILFIKCETNEDMSKITSKLNNLPPSNDKDSPRAITSVPQAGKRRYQSYKKIARAGKRIKIYKQQ